MEKWLLPRGKKETRTCYSCGDYKMSAKFYEWYHHPGLKFMGNDIIGIICRKCAKREAGSRLWKRMTGG